MAYRIVILPFLQVGLFKNTVERARCQVVGEFARHSNTALLTRVLKLTVAAATRNFDPSIIPQH
jgi:hypothetical protein